MIQRGIRVLVHHQHFFLPQGGIIVRDIGKIADAAFAVYIDGDYRVCETEISDTNNPIINPYEYVVLAYSIHLHLYHHNHFYFQLYLHLNLLHLKHRMCIMKNIKADEGIVYSNDGMAKTTNTTNGNIELMKININKDSNIINETDNANNKIEGTDGILTEREKIKQWLTYVVHLEQYFELLVDINGFDSFEAIRELTDDTMQQINIEKIGHRMKLIKYIENL
eukprot:240195_1